MPCHQQNLQSSSKRPTRAHFKNLQIQFHHGTCKSKLQGEDEETAEGGKEEEPMPSCAQSAANSQPAPSLRAQSSSAIPCLMSTSCSSAQPRPARASSQRRRHCPNRRRASLHATAATCPAAKPLRCRRRTKPLLRRTSRPTPLCCRARAQSNLDVVCISVLCRQRTKGATRGDPCRGLVGL
ncbi:hypothetical protein M0R45_026911 [Rubus argutus]|uniref:Uncharacterized protein n=1 Tax=Rubus argutus TaxID=59490 RepID=A0AAW1X1L3_RUBAR